MSGTYSITFNTCTNGFKTMCFDGNTSINDIFTQYAKSIGIQNSLNDYMFFANGEKITINSSTKIINSSLKGTTVLVVEKEAFGICDDEEELDKINKKEFKNRNCKNWGKSLQDTLSDMALFGCITRKVIKNTLSIKGNSLISYEEAINKSKNDSQLFTLGILAKYLNNLGILTLIENNYENINEKYKNMSIAVLQFIFNGLIFKKKYYLSFKLSAEKINNLFQPYTKYQDDFKNNLINAISEIYGIPKKEIIISSPIHDEYYLLMVIINNEKVTITKEVLMNKFQSIPDLCQLISVKKENIIDGIILNRSMLDPEGDNKDGGWGYYEKRGGEDYLPPEGWDRYGLSVTNRYDNCNNDWLSYDNREGEWCIAYGWLSYNKDTIDLSQYENDNDIKHKGKKVGKGIYCSQDPEVMENYTEAVEIKGEKYKLGLMLRVNPSNIRCPENKEDLWVVDGFSDDIRPYGILIQKIS